MPPTTYKYTHLYQVPVAFWLYILDIAYKFNMTNAEVASDETFISNYDNYRGAYRHLRGRVRGYVGKFGEGSFVCDGVMVRHGDDKAGRPHCCALLKQEHVPPPP